MSAKIIDGKAFASQIGSKLRQSSGSNGYHGPLENTRAGVSYAPS
jgi:hypothetical protein